MGYWLRDRYVTTIHTSPRTMRPTMTGTNHRGLTFGPADFACGGVYVAFLRDLDSGTVELLSKRCGPRATSDRRTVAEVLGRTGDMG
jgi:hypothetical protein